MTPHSSDHTPTPVPPSPDWESVARYLGQGEDVDGVRQWLADHPGDAALIAAVDQTAETLGAVRETPIDVEAALRKVKAQLDESVAGSIMPPARQKFAARQRRPERNYGWRIAAGIVVAVMGAWTWQRMHSKPATEQSQIAALSYDAAVGKRETVRLSDGSSVVLAPGSHLTVSSGYGTQDRQVELQGEAYFDVVHDGTHQFVIRAGGAVIRDVGTTFTVRAREGAAIRVAVTSGVVQLQSASANADSGVLLQKGDAGSLGANGVASAVRGGASDDDVAWKDGRLVFRDTPLSDVAVEIRRWYGVNLVIDDPALARSTLVHSTKPTDSADSLLSVIAQIKGAHLEKSKGGDTVYLRRNR